AVGRRTQEIENCNRTRQTVKVVVTAGTSLITEGLPDRNQRFRPGSFHAGATLFACKNTGGAYTDCRELTDRETIQIK
ncbi:MAG TPA: hypothetical protein VHJ19_02290, partial [Gammaproteobacteria bacterium]|nr:hypothetical protein [Gammaproteobacteria bacterium]